MKADRALARCVQLRTIWELRGVRSVPYVTALHHRWSRNIMIFSTLCPCSVHIERISVVKNAKKLRKHVNFASMQRSEDLNGTEFPMHPS
jgi:hypothetical protein